MERITRKEEEVEVEEEEEVFYSPERIITDKNKDERKEVIINGYNECSDEQKKLNQMRAIVQNQNPSCKEINDSTLRRFLHARDLDVDKASAMLTKYLKWRQEFVPNGFITNSQVQNDIEQNKVFVLSHGTDKKGLPIAVVFGAKHFARNGGLDELKYYVVFALDKVCSRIPDGKEKFTIIIDLQGYVYSNIDIRGYTAALSILQDYYPERLEKLFFIHVPYLFMTAWKMLYPFIDKNTKKKIVFVQDKKLKATLMEEIEETQLPQIYGGKLQLIPIQDA